MLVLCLGVSGYSSARGGRQTKKKAISSQNDMPFFCSFKFKTSLLFLSIKQKWTPEEEAVLKQDKNLVHEDATCL